MTVSISHNAVVTPERQVIPEQNRRKYRIQTVDNVLDILEAISDSKGDVALARLCEKLKISKNTLFRILKTFELRGYLEPSMVSGKYRIGLSAFKTSRKFLLQMDLLIIAKPHMESLAHECNETVYLALPFGNEILLFDSVTSTHSIQIMSLVGKYYKQEKISAGKIVMAYSNTFDTDPEFEKTRVQELCIDHGELDDGVSSVAVPLFKTNKKVAGCLCFIGPTYRFTDDSIQKKMFPRIRSAAQAISAKLGYFDGHR